jgi:hypothetical protein
VGRRLGLNRADLRLAGILLAAVLIAFAPWAWSRIAGGRTEATAFVVKVHTTGQSLRLDPAADGRFAVTGPLGPTVVAVAGGRARILASPCAEPSWHGGWVSRPGQRSVCAPNRVVLEVVGETGPEGLDAETH